MSASENRWGRGTVRGAVIAAALLATGAAPARAWAGAPAFRPMTPDEFERRHGIRVVRVAVEGAGGLVDLRLLVTDRARAGALLADPSRAPRIVAGEGKKVLSAPHRMQHAVAVRQGAVSYLLFPNVGDAVRAGARVAVAFGEVRVGPVVAQ